MNRAPVLGGLALLALSGLSLGTLTGTSVLTADATALAAQYGEVRATVAVQAPIAAVLDTTVESAVEFRAELVAARSAVRPAHAVRPLAVKIVTFALVSSQVRVAPATATRLTSTLFKGQKIVVTAGKSGIKQRTIKIRYVNGKRVSAHLYSVRTLKAPITRVVAFGTKSRPFPVHKVSGVSGLNWKALANCESGGRTGAVGGGGRYLGLYQFMLSTWHSLGGTGSPVTASAAEQTYRAQRLYRSQGRSPWPYCGRFL